MKLMRYNGMKKILATIPRTERSEELRELGDARRNVFFFARAAFERTNLSAS